MPSLSTGVPFLRAGVQRGASATALSTRRLRRLSVDSSSCHDRVAFGRYGVTQDDAGGRFVVAPLHLPGDVAAEGGVGGENGGLVVAERDEHHPVCGFVAVAGDGLLVGRKRFDPLDVLGRNRGDLLRLPAVHDVERLLRRGRQEGGAEKREQGECVSFHGRSFSAERVRRGEYCPARVFPLRRRGFSLSPDSPLSASHPERARSAHPLGRNRTPSASSSVRWASHPGAVRPAAFTTRWQGTPSGAAASTCPTWRA